MSQKTDNLIAVLDMGSSKTRVLIAELNDGALRYRGHAIVEAAGMRKGVITELKPAAESINKAATLAEKRADATIEKCVIAVGGPHVDRKSVV